MSLQIGQSNVVFVVVFLFVECLVWVRSSGLCLVIGNPLMLAGVYLGYEGSGPWTVLWGA